jgi:hypothetical protein
MPEIKDEDLVRLHLRARDLSEAALVCSRTSPRDGAYADRMQMVQEAVKAVAELLEASK